MSWFSNRFSTSAMASDSGDGDQDDEHNAQGKGVKEDLSELTKGFTQKIWGVASFLAPPASARPAAEAADPPASLPNHIVKPGQGIDSVSRTGENSFSHELVDVDFQASADDPGTRSEEEALDQADDSRRSESGGISNVAADHGLTGMGKDLAELRVGVATGFSKLLKVVREEIDRSEHAKARHDREYNEEEEDEESDDDVESKGIVHGRRIPVINSLLKPLLSGILQHDKDDMLQESGTDDEYDDDPLYERGHQKSRPSGTLNLGRTLGESLESVSKLASSLFPVNLDSDDEESTVEISPNFEAVGVTEEVLTFAKNISMHPETWLDFPLFSDDDEDDDFDMSDAQKEHVHEVERVSPRLAALRIELCPDYMSEGRFWKIYFVLLHSRLSKKDMVLLSTPQIMEARSLLLRNLQKKASEKSTSESYQQQHLQKGEASGSAESFKIVSLQSALEVPAKDFDHAENVRAKQGRLPSPGDNVGDMSEEVQNKNVLANTVKLATLNCEEDEADVDRWLHEDSPLHFSVSGSAGLANDDDVSFSDLEDEDDSVALKGAGSSNFKGMQGWVELNKDQKGKEFTPGKARPDELEKPELGSKMQNRRESSDWLTV